MASKVRKSAKKALMSEMNVTPMIAVMLVLLVIFMVAAPLLTVGVKVNLPEVNAASVESKEKPIVIYMDAERRVYVGETEVQIETIDAKLKAIAGETDAKIFVRGDRSLPYGVIMELMGRISNSGFKKVVLVTELPKAKGKHGGRK